VFSRNDQNEAVTKHLEQAKVAIARGRLKEVMQNKRYVYFHGCGYIQSGPKVTSLVARQVRATFASDSSMAVLARCFHSSIPQRFFWWNFE
jgi:hypothetical protein